MKILQIIYSLISGGAERFAVDLSNELADQGHQVVLCMLRDPEVQNFGFYRSEISRKVTFRSLNIPEGFRIGNIYRLFRLIQEEEPDIVHCHLNLVNYIYLLTHLFKKVKFYHTLHNDASTLVSSRLEFLLSRHYYLNSKVRAVTISSESSHSFAAFYKHKVYREIVNGRKTPRITEMYPVVAGQFENMKKGGTKVFLHIGRCSYQKNQQLLIQVFNRLVSAGKPVYLIVLGSGFNSEEGRQLQQEACEKIVFLGEQHNIADYLHTADALCLTSRHEGMPISLIEALACGCTPVCTPVGGVVDAIEHGKTGYLSASTSEEDYYRTVHDFLDVRFKIRREDLERHYREHFSIETCARKHIELYSNAD